MDVTDTLARPRRSELHVAALRALDAWTHGTMGEAACAMENLDDALRAESARMQASTVVEKKDA